MYLDLDDELPNTWKYPGYPLREVMERDPEYIQWLLETEKITISEDTDNYWQSVKHGGY